MWNWNLVRMHLTEKEENKQNYRTVLWDCVIWVLDLQLLLASLNL